MSADRRVTATLLPVMIREEWRLHSTLFGGRRFAVFPVLIALASAGMVWLLVFTGTAPATIALWLHLLVFAFGLYTGSVGLIGRDGMRDLLGDLSLVLFSARTLPLSQRRLLGTFLVKDIIYYAVLFLVPLTVAYAPAAATAGDLARLPLLWLTLTGTFVVGLVVTFSAISARTRGRAGTAVLLAGAVLVGLAWATGINLLDWLPYGFYNGAGGVTPAVGFLATLGIAAVGLAAFDPTSESTSRTTGPDLLRWQRRLRYDSDGLVAKSLIDVARSSGGVWKVVFSGAILFAVTAGLVELVETITGLEPSTGLSFGAVLGLTSFTTYNWVTQFDDPDTYLHHPIATAAVFEAKFRSFLVLGLPTVLGYYLLAVGLWGERALVAVAGGVLVVGLSIYLFGLTVALTGLEPNTFLFDTARFAAFSIGSAVPLVPVLIVGFVVEPSPGLLALLAATGVVLGLGGVGLFRWSVPRWTERFRMG